MNLPVYLYRYFPQLLACRVRLLGSGRRLYRQVTYLHQVTIDLAGDWACFSAAQRRP